MPDDDRLPEWRVLEEEFQDWARIARSDPDPSHREAAAARVTELAKVLASTSGSTGVSAPAPKDDDIGRMTDEELEQELEALLAEYQVDRTITP